MAALRVLGDVNDAYRPVDWFLAVPLLLVELVVVMGLMLFCAGATTLTVVYDRRSGRKSSLWRADP